MIVDQLIVVGLLSSSPKSCCVGCEEEDAIRRGSSAIYCLFISINYLFHIPVFNYYMLTENLVTPVFLPSSLHTYYR